MRKVVLAVLGLAVAVPCARGQEVAGWAAKLFRTPDGQIPTGHDFGTVPRGAQLKHRFPITNIYAVPLRVSAGVSCGCVTATPNPPVLQPRETGYLDITMDTTRFSGPKAVTVTVTVAGQQYYSSTALQITGNCRLDVTLEPGQAVFGVVPSGHAVPKDVTVRYFGVYPWQITGPAGENDLFDVHYQQAYRQPGQVGYRVQLALKPGAPPGTHKGELQLLTNDPNNRVVQIPYEVTVQAALSATPDVTRFGAVKAGEPATPRRAFVRASKPFRIVGVEGDGDGLSVEYPQTANMIQTVTIKLQPTQPGRFQRTITIKTDLDGGASVQHRVEATVQ